MESEKDELLVRLLLVQMLVVESDSMRDHKHCGLQYQEYPPYMTVVLGTLLVLTTG